MNRDELIVYLQQTGVETGVLDWDAIEAFVFDWIEHLADGIVDGYTAQAIADQWRGEMREGEDGIPASEADLQPTSHRERAGRLAAGDDRGDDLPSGRTRAGGE